MGKAGTSLFVPFMKSLRAIWDSEAVVPFLSPVNVVMGIVGPGGVMLTHKSS